MARCRDHQVRRRASWTSVRWTELSKKVGCNMGHLAIHRYDHADHGIGHDRAHCGRRRELSCRSAKYELRVRKKKPLQARLSCCLPRASYDTLGILCVMSLTVAAVQNEEPAHGGGHH